VGYSRFGSNKSWGTEIENLKERRRTRGISGDGVREDVF
jgi:hypothetical protein